MKTKSGKEVVNISRFPVFTSPSEDGIPEMSIKGEIDGKTEWWDIKGRHYNIPDFTRDPEMDLVLEEK